jgi:hypothetical protein
MFWIRPEPTKVKSLSGVPGLNAIKQIAEYNYSSKWDFLLGVNFQNSKNFLKMRVKLKSAHFVCNIN